MVVLNSSSFPPPDPRANTYNIYISRNLLAERAKGSAGSAEDFGSVLAAASRGSEDMIHSFFTQLGIETKDHVITLDDLKRAAERLQKKVNGAINLLFEQNGIDTSQAVTLRINRDGYVVAKDDCKDKRKIDAALMASPELCNDIRGLSVLQDLIRAGEEATKGKVTARLNLDPDDDEDKGGVKLKRQGVVKSIFELVMNNGVLSIKG